MTIYENRASTILFNYLKSNHTGTGYWLIPLNDHKHLESFKPSWIEDRLTIKMTSKGINRGSVTAQLGEVIYDFFKKNRRKYEYSI